MDGEAPKEAGDGVSYARVGIPAIGDITMGSQPTPTPSAPAGTLSSSFDGEAARAAMRALIRQGTPAAPFGAITTVSAQRVLVEHGAAGTDLNVLDAWSSHVADDGGEMAAALAEWNAHNQGATLTTAQDRAIRDAARAALYQQLAPVIQAVSQLAPPTPKVGFQINLGAVGKEIVACVKAAGTWSSKGCTTTRQGVVWDRAQLAFVATPPTLAVKPSSLLVPILLGLAAIGSIAWMATHRKQATA